MVLNEPALQLGQLAQDAAIAVVEGGALAEQVMVVNPSLLVERLHESSVPPAAGNGLPVEGEVGTNSTL